MSQSKYIVIGQRIISDEIDKHEEAFSDYNTAIDYYSDTFRDVSYDVCHIGGEFVITLIEVSENPKILKRNLTSTTV